MAELIKVYYSAVDGCKQTRKYKTMKGAAKFAQLMVGAYPEISNTFKYAVSSDGIGKIQASCDLYELFPDCRPMPYYETRKEV